MSDTLIRSWWVPAMRGAVAILFGLLAIARPDITLAALVGLFAAYSLLSGVASIIGAIRNRRHDEDWGMLLLLGIVGIAAGIIAIVQPGLTALTLVLLIGANALVTGVLDIAAAMRLRRVLRDEWLLMLSGAASIVFGIVVFMYPGAGALAMIWMISVYAFLTGFLLLGVALRLRAKTRTGMPERRTHGDRRISPAHP